MVGALLGQFCVILGIVGFPDCFGERSRLSISFLVFLFWGVYMTDVRGAQTKVEQVLRGINAGKLEAQQDKARIWREDFVHSGGWSWFAAWGGRGRPV